MERWLIACAIQLIICEVNLDEAYLEEAGRIATSRRQLKLPRLESDAAIRPYKIREPTKQRIAFPKAEKRIGIEVPVRIYSALVYSV